MPKTYKKRTARTFPEGSMKRAVMAVLQDSLSIRKSAELHGIKKSRLGDYVKRAKNVGVGNMSFVPNFKIRQVLSNEMENSLSEYLLKCSNMFYGLTPKAVRRLTYEYAKRNSLKMPESWKKNELAGRDWFTGYLERHPTLSLRTPEATSLARMTSFNKNNIEQFFDKLEQVITRHSFTLAQIYNLDETGVTTVHRVQKVVAKRGQHQIGQATSRERGELITQVGIISASGIALPPVWVFPRKRFDEKRMLQGLSQTGALGLVHQSGWMTSANFIMVLKHIVKHTHCTAENKILVVLDNHESHVSIESIDFCRDNGIVLLTLPPHTSNKTQPLDRTVFGPFKTFFNQGADAWMLANPGQTLTIYDLPPICAVAWDRAATPVNIKSGFRCTGIWPYDKNIFSEADFLCSTVTDRQMVPQENLNSRDSYAIPTTSNSSPEIQATISNVSPEAATFISPEQIQPYPRAGPRKTTRRGRAKKKSIIATDTPEKEALIEKKTKKVPEPKLRQVKRKIVETSSESETEEWKENCSDEDVDVFCNSEDENDDKPLEAGDYAVVKVYRKKSTEARHFVAKIQQTLNNSFEVQFLKRQFPSYRFSTTNELALVVKTDVVAKLPVPLQDNRPRFLDMLYFNLDLQEYSL